MASWPMYAWVLLIGVFIGLSAAGILWLLLSDRGDGDEEEEGQR